MKLSTYNRYNLTKAQTIGVNRGFEIECIQSSQRIAKLI